jgi:hypothetical protein
VAEETGNRQHQQRRTDDSPDDRAFREGLLDLLKSETSALTAHGDALDRLAGLFMSFSGTVVALLTTIESALNGSMPGGAQSAPTYEKPMMLAGRALCLVAALTALVAIVRFRASVIGDYEQVAAVVSREYGDGVIPARTKALLHRVTLVQAEGARKTKQMMSRKVRWVYASGTLLLMGIVLVTASDVAV